MHPTVVIGCLTMLGWYFASRPRIAKRAVYFCLGVLVLCLSLVSPIESTGR